MHWCRRWALTGQHRFREEDSTGSSTSSSDGGQLPFHLAMAVKAYRLLSYSTLALPNHACSQNPQKNARPAHLIITAGTARRRMRRRACAAILFTNYGNLRTDAMHRWEDIVEQVNQYRQQRTTGLYPHRYRVASIPAMDADSAHLVSVCRHKNRQ